MNISNTRRIKNLIQAATLFCLVCLNSSLAQEAATGSEAVKAILSQASNKLNHAKTLKAEIVDETATGAKVKRTHYQRNLPDGTVEMRDETHASDKIPFEASVIVNSLGSFMLLPTSKVAVKLGVVSDLTKQISSSGLIGPEVSKLATMTLKEKTFNNKACFSIVATMKKEFVEKTREQIVKFREAQAAKTESTVSPSKVIDPARITPKLFEFIINKETHNFESISTYAEDGSLISGLVYKQIVIDLPLSEGLFSVPKDFKIKEAETFEQLATLLVNEIQKKKEVTIRLSLVANAGQERESYVRADKKSFRPAMAAHFGDLRYGMLVWRPSVPCLAGRNREKDSSSEGYIYRTSEEHRTGTSFTIVSP